MITLNIAPESLKKKIKSNVLFKMLKGVFVILLFSLAFFVTSLITCFLLLNSYSSNIKSQSYTITKSTEDFTNKADIINKKIDEIALIQKGYTEFSNLFKFFSSNHNNNINISRIGVNKAEDTLRVAGQAKTRDDLLGLQEKINQSGIFEEAVLPFSNLVKETNISFEIVAKFKNYEFENIK